MFIFTLTDDLGNREFGYCYSFMEGYDADEVCKRICLMSHVYFVVLCDLL